MNKTEYKQLSHDIRSFCRSEARTLTEVTGKKHTTRFVMHNAMLWRDNYKTDKYGNDLFTYRCIGNDEIGLVWEKAFNVNRRLDV